MRRGSKAPRPARWRCSKPSGQRCADRLRGRSRTAHECGDSRYLAIPFFDACLEFGFLQRKQNANSQAHRYEVNPVGSVLSETASSAEKFEGKAEEAVWLPGEVCESLERYMRAGATSDTTPACSADGRTVKRLADGKVELNWLADADFESGIQGFVIERDGKQVAQIPEKPVGKFGRALFQGMSYHDTSQQPVAKLQFVDTSAEAGKPHEYRVRTINSVGLKSDPSAAAALAK